MVKPGFFAKRVYDSQLSRRIQVSHEKYLRRVLAERQAAAAAPSHGHTLLLHICNMIPDTWDRMPGN